MNERALAEALQVLARCAHKRGALEEAMWFAAAADAVLAPPEPAKREEPEPKYWHNCPGELYDYAHDYGDCGGNLVSGCGFRKSPDAKQEPAPRRMKGGGQNWHRGEHDWISGCDVEPRCEPVGGDAKASEPQEEPEKEFNGGSIDAVSDSGPLQATRTAPVEQTSVKSEQAPAIPRTWANVSRIFSNGCWNYVEKITVVEVVPE